MKIILQTLFFFLLLAQFCFAQVNWTKYPDNPIFSGQPGTWYAYLSMCSVLYNPDSSRYEMWFTAGAQAAFPYNIGFAWSDDGISWNVHTANPVLTSTPGSWDAYMVFDPLVIRENGQYKMWYAGIETTALLTKIGYATSPDGINWQKDTLNNPVLLAGTASWESAAVSHPFVISDSNGYKMWYSGSASGASQTAFGYATSPDGINWQKDTLNNPVLLAGVGGEWDRVVYGPEILYIDSLYYMLYTGQNNLYQSDKVGLATSSDEIHNWYKHGPVLQPTPGQWDGSRTIIGCVFMEDDTIKMYYAGSNGSNWEIGLATSILIDTIHIPQDYSTIQEGINAAVDGNLVLVEEGTYIENINFKGKAITVASRFLIDGDETHIENTIIDGSQPVYTDSASVVTFRSGEDTTSVICGFTIRGGSGTIIPHATLLVRMGGGVLVYSSDASIKNNIIESNNIQHSTDSYGGGICALSENGNNYIIENNTIRENSITTPSIVYYSLGGGIYTLTTGYVRILNNKILNNVITAPTAYGGGVVPAGANNNDYFILNNFISGNILNAATGGSGGLDIYNHNPVIKNNLIILNSAPTGGGLLIESASPVFSNNTISNNTATVSGGGINIIGANPSMMNCIIWGNTAPTGSQINGTAGVSYSDVEGGLAGTGNINEDPLFDGSEFYLLSANSPCIDAGNPDPMYNDVEDPNNPGFALWPAQGALTNDMGSFGGPNSFWFSIVTLVEEEKVDFSQPTTFILFQNYPNPFNPSTKIKYSVPQTSQVQIKVFDVLGNEIETLVNEEKQTGTYELNWNAEGLPSGVYFYQLKAGSFVETKKMILLK